MFIFYTFPVDTQVLVAGRCMSVAPTCVTVTIASPWSWYDRDPVCCTTLQYVALYEHQSCHLCHIYIYISTCAFLFSYETGYAYCVVSPWRILCYVAMETCKLCYRFSTICRWTNALIVFTCVRYRTTTTDRTFRCQVRKRIVNRHALQHRLAVKVWLSESICRKQVCVDCARQT